MLSESSLQTVLPGERPNPFNVLQQAVIDFLDAFSEAVRTLLYVLEYQTK